MWYGIRGSRKLTEMLREMAREIREADGIIPLKPGETRTSDYYSFNRYTTVGRKPLWLSKGDNKKAK